MLDNLNELFNNPLHNLKIIGPDRNEQAGLTLPPTAVGRPVKPSVLPSQPTNQTPTDKK